MYAKIFSTLVFVGVSCLAYSQQAPSMPGSPAPIPGIALAAAAAAGYGLKKARDARKNMEE